jgi:hypothetical protein
MTSAAIMAAWIGAASAATLPYSGYNVVGNTNVAISYAGPPVVNESGGSGQIDLLNTPHGSVPTWCIDIFDFLQGGGTYTIGGPLTNNGGGAGGMLLSPTQIGEIGALITHGNYAITHGSAFPYSPATQLAIWAIEYRGISLTSSDASVQALFPTLVTDAETIWAPNYHVMALTQVNGQGLAVDQGLAILPEPGSLALLGAGLFGLSLVLRRRG